MGKNGMGMFRGNGTLGDMNPDLAAKRQGRFMTALTLLAVAAAIGMIMLGGLALLGAGTAEAWPTKFTSCTSCHSALDPDGVLTTALNGVSGTTLSLSSGFSGTFEVDWRMQNVTFDGTYRTMGTLIAVPTGWTVSAGTANSPAIAGWNTVWDVTASNGVTPPAPFWSTSFSTATEFPNSPVGYTVDFGSSPWDGDGTGGGKTRNPACDGGATACVTGFTDQDGVADNMGMDATVTVPGGTGDGTYEIVVVGVGHHSGSGKSYASATLTITIGGGATAPTLSAPTASAITSTTATLGATIDSDGGAAITARGTVWDTTAAPTANALAEGGTATGAFSHGRTGLPAQTRVYYRGYATNAQGTGYSPDGSFYTEPATGPAGVNFTGVGTNGMTVNWTRGSGNAVIVLMKQGTAVDTDPVDGTYTGYTANTAFGSGTQIGTGNYVIFKGAGTSVAVTGLSSSTTYHVAVYELAGTVDSTGNDQGANYNQTSAATGSQATTGTNNPPNLPGSDNQYKSDTTTLIPQGTYTDEGTVVVKGTVSDPDADTVRLQVEIKAVAVAFDGTVSCNSVFVASGNVAEATCSGLSDGEYKWRARTDDGTLQSAWQEF